MDRCWPVILCTCVALMFANAVADIIIAQRWAWWFFAASYAITGVCAVRAAWRGAR